MVERCPEEAGVDSSILSLGKYLLTQIFPQFLFLISIFKSFCINFIFLGRNKTRLTPASSRLRLWGVHFKTFYL